MRTTLDLDPQLLEHVRVEARRRGVTVKELLATLLRRGLDGDTARPPRYRCPTFRLGAPVAGLNLDKALDLAAALNDEEIARELMKRRCR